MLTHASVASNLAASLGKKKIKKRRMGAIRQSARTHACLLTCSLARTAGSTWQVHCGIPFHPCLLLFLFFIFIFFSPSTFPLSMAGDTTPGDTSCVAGGCTVEAVPAVSGKPSRLLRRNGSKGLTVQVPAGSFDCCILHLFYPHLSLHPPRAKEGAGWSERPYDSLGPEDHDQPWLPIHPFLGRLGRTYSLGLVFHSIRCPPSSGSPPPAVGPGAVCCGSHLDEEGCGQVPRGRMYTRR